MACSRNRYGQSLLQLYELNTDSLTSEQGLSPNDLSVAYALMSAAGLVSPAAARHFLRPLRPPGQAFVLTTCCTDTLQSVFVLVRVTHRVWRRDGRWPRCCPGRRSIGCNGRACCRNEQHMVTSRHPKR